MQEYARLSTTVCSYDRLRLLLNRTAATLRQSTAQHKKPDSSSRIVSSRATHGQTDSLCPTELTISIFLSLPSLLLPLRVKHCPLILRIFHYGMAMKCDDIINFIQTISVKIEQSWYQWSYEEYMCTCVMYVRCVRAVCTHFSNSSAIEQKRSSRAGCK